MHFKCRLPIDGLGQCKARIEEALHRHFPAHHFSIIGDHNYSE